MITPTAPTISVVNFTHHDLETSVSIQTEAALKLVQAQMETAAAINEIAQTEQAVNSQIPVTTDGSSSAVDVFV